MKSHRCPLQLDGRNLQFLYKKITAICGKYLTYAIPCKLHHTIYGLGLGWVVVVRDLCQWGLGTVVWGLLGVFLYKCEGIILG